MRQPVLQDNGGFTLVEFMIALLILTIGLLGLLETVNFSIRSNLSNKLRSDAIMLADQEMLASRSLPFADIEDHIDSKKASAIFVNYSVAREVEDTSPSTKNVTIRVKWRDRREIKEHYLTTIISSN